MKLKYRGGVEWKNQSQRWPLYSLPCSSNFGFPAPQFVGPPSLGLSSFEVRWILISGVKLSPKCNSSSNSSKNGTAEYLIEREEGTNDHSVIHKCIEIQNVISKGAIFFSSSPNIYILESSWLSNLDFRLPWLCGGFQHKESTLLIQRRRDFFLFYWGFTAFCDTFDVSSLFLGLCIELIWNHLRRDVFITEGCKRSILHTY